MYPCKRENCDEVFSQNSNRSRHQKKCDKGEIVIEKKIHQCENDWCKKIFIKKSNLQRHKLKCVRKKKKVHCCSRLSCSKTFTSDYKLQRHLESHDPKKMFTCGGCSATYIRKDKYLRHKESCTNLSTSEGLSDMNFVDDDASGHTDEGYEIDIYDYTLLSGYNSFLDSSAQSASFSAACGSSSSSASNEDGFASYSPCCDSTNFDASAETASFSAARGYSAYISDSESEADSVVFDKMIPNCIPEFSESDEDSSDSSDSVAFDIVAESPQQNHDDNMLFPRLELFFYWTPDVSDGSLEIAPVS